MKYLTHSLVAALLATTSVSLLAQDSDPGQGHPRPHRGGPPMAAVLDANKDGVLDASEIANASAALLTLDKNGDGQLTADELGRPGRGGGPEGKGGPGGRRGPRPPQPVE